MSTVEQTGKKTSPRNWLLGAILLVIISIGVFMFPHASSPVTTGMSTASATTAPLSPFRTKYLSAFIKSCQKVEGFGSSTLCTCIGNHLLTSYGNTQLMKISVDYKATGKIPAQVVAAAAACR